MRNKSRELAFRAIPVICLGVSPIRLAASPVSQLEQRTEFPLVETPYMEHIPVCGIPDAPCYTAEIFTDPMCGRNRNSNYPFWINAHVQ